MAGLLTKLTGGVATLPWHPKDVGRSHTGRAELGPALGGEQGGCP